MNPKSAVQYLAKVSEAWIAPGLNQTITGGSPVEIPKQLLPKDLLPALSEGDRSSEWMEIAQSDSLSAGMQIAAAQGSQLQAAYGSSFGASTIMLGYPGSIMRIR